MKNPKTLEEAKRIIKRLLSKESKLFREMTLAKARCYDIWFGHKPEPESHELKSEVVYLREELGKVVTQRDALKSERRGSDVSSIAKIGG
jgi:hypothetical protein